MFLFMHLKKKVSPPWLSLSCLYDSKVLDFINLGLWCLAFEQLFTCIVSYLSLKSDKIVCQMSKCSWSSHFRNKALKRAVSAYSLPPGQQYWLFENTNSLSGYPKPIADWGMRHSDGKPVTTVEAAFVYAHNGRTFLFSGNEFWGFSNANNVRILKLDEGYPKPASMWKGMPSKPDDIISYGDGKTAVDNFVFIRSCHTFRCLSTCTLCNDNKVESNLKNWQWPSSDVTIWQRMWGDIIWHAWPLCTQETHISSRTTPIGKWKRVDWTRR